MPESQTSFKDPSPVLGVRLPRLLILDGTDVIAGTDDKFLLRPLCKPDPQWHPGALRLFSDYQGASDNLAPPFDDHSRGPFFEFELVDEHSEDSMIK